MARRERSGAVPPEEECSGSPRGSVTGSERAGVRIFDPPCDAITTGTTGQVAGRGCCEEGGGC